MQLRCILRGLSVHCRMRAAASTQRRLQTAWRAPLDGVPPGHASRPTRIGGRRAAVQLVSRRSARGGRCGGDLQPRNQDHAAVPRRVLQATWTAACPADVPPYRQVEDDGGVMRVREPKFHRSRLLPLSASTRAELLAHLVRRADASIGCGTQPTAPLLCTRARGRMKPYPMTGLQQGSNALLRGAVMAAETQRPRVMTFATALPSRRWLAGIGKAPMFRLSYRRWRCTWGMSIESTAHYLHWTDGIATLASERFAQHSSSTIGGRS